MAIKSYFFNAEESGGVYDRTYNAEDMTSYLDDIIGNGVFMNPSNSLQVVHKEGRVVTVKEGSAWINGHKIILTEDMDLTTPVKGTAQIASVIVAANMTDREMQIYLSVTSDPNHRPPLTRNTSRWEMELAYIYLVEDGGSVANNIHDSRMDSDRCGVVQGLIQQVDTSSIFEQWQTAWETWFTGVKNAFVAGSILRRQEGIKRVYTAGNRFNVLEALSSYNPDVDKLEVYVDGIHQDGSKYYLNNDYIVFYQNVPAGSLIDFIAYRLVVPS